MKGASEIAPICLFAIISMILVMSKKILLINTLIN